MQMQRVITIKVEEQAFSDEDAWSSWIKHKLDDRPIRIILSGKKGMHIDLKAVA